MTPRRWGDAGRGALTRRRRSCMRSRRLRLPIAGFVTSRAAIAHWLASVLGAGDLRHFHSYRLMLGEVGRGLAAYCGESVYLDVAMTWVVSRTATCPVAMRRSAGRASGYSLRPSRVAFLADGADRRDEAAAARRIVRCAARCVAFR